MLLSVALLLSPQALVSAAHERTQQRVVYTLIQEYLGEHIAYACRRRRTG